jgi:SAM-dependent methyltransferase
MAYEELKERQSVMWGNGPYERITATLGDIHDLVIERLAPAPGDRWLDLATGTGAIAERAAAAGASVTGIDLSPVLIETAQEKATGRGLEIDYRVGDVERLDLPDASFDKVSSTVGIMFAPDHEATARELARVMAPYLPAPPPSSPFDWGDEAKVQQLLGDAFDLEIEERVSPFVTESGETYWDLFATSYGPTKTLADGLGDRRDELQQDWVEFFETNHRSDGQIVHPREYLLISGIRR